MEPVVGRRLPVFPHLVFLGHCGQGGDDAGHKLVHQFVQAAKEVRLDACPRRGDHGSAHGSEHGWDDEAHGAVPKAPRMKRTAIARADTAVHTCTSSQRRQ